MDLYDTIPEKPDKITSPTLLDDADILGLGGKVIAGAGLGAGKIAFDVGKVGIASTQIAKAMLTLDLDAKLDLGDDFWTTYESISGLTTPTATKVTGELASYAASSAVMMSKLATMPKFAKLMQSSNAWDRYKAAMGIGAITDVATTTLHSSSKDESILNLVPEEHRGAVMNWFVDRTDDTDAEVLLKNVAEGLAIGGTVESGIALLAKAFRSTKATIHSTVEPSNTEEILDTLDGVLGKGDGSVKSEFIEKNTVVGSVLQGDPKAGTNKVQELSLAQPALGQPVKQNKIVEAGFSKEEIEVIAGLPNKANELMQSILDNPKATLKEKDAAKAYLKNKDLRDFTKRNLKNSGAGSLKNGLEINLLLGMQSKFPKRDPRSMAKAYADAMVSYSQGTLGFKDTLKAMSRKFGYGEANIMHQLATANALGKDMEEVLAASMVMRTRHGEKLQSIAKEIVGSGLGSSSPKIKQLLQQWELLDFYDSNVQGVVSSSGRLLNYAQVNPNDITKKMNQDLAEARRLVAEGKEIPEEVSAYEFFTQTITKEDDGRLAAMLDTIVKADVVDAKTLQKAMEGYEMMDYLEAFVFGSLLASPRTVIGSVLMSGGALTAWKQIVMRGFQAAVAKTAKYLPVKVLDDSKHSSATFNDVLIATEAMVGTTFKEFSRFFKSDLDRKLIKSIGGTREGVEGSLGTMTRAQLKNQMQLTATRLDAEGAYIKSSLMNVAQKLVSPIMAAQNWGIRGIEAIDDFWKSVNAETTLAVQANRVWYSEGSREIFGSAADTKDVFIDKYMALQRGYREAMELSGEAQQKALDRLWQGVNHTARLSVIKDVKEASRMSLEATMQQPVDNTAVGAAFGTLRSHISSSPVGRFAMMSVFPFTRTPINNLTEVIDHSPLAWTTNRWRNILKNGTPEEKLDIVSRMVAGFSLVSTVAFAANSGLLLGGDPKDNLLALTGVTPQGERELFKAERRLEHSILLNGTWYSYEKLGPIASLLSAAADLSKLMLSDDQAGVSNILAQSIAIAADDSHLKAIEEIIAIMRDPNAINELKSFAIDKTTKAITPLYGAQNSLRDLVVNRKYTSTVDAEVGGLAQELKAWIAKGLKSNTLFIVGTNAIGGGVYETDIDMVNNDVRASSDTIVGRAMHFMGLGNMDHTDEPWVQELVDFKMLPRNWNSNMIEGVPMSQQQMKKYTRKLYAHNGRAQEGLNQLVTSDAYLSIENDLDKKGVLTQALNVYKEYAKALTVEEDANLQHKIYMKKLFDIAMRNRKSPELGKTVGERVRGSTLRKAMSDTKNKVLLKEYMKEFGEEGTLGTSKSPRLEDVKQEFNLE
jgi:hypothetical protein